MTDDKLRVLAFTCSRHRPLMLRHAVLQVQQQTYPLDHAIYVNSDIMDDGSFTTDYTDLLSDIRPSGRNRIFISYGSSFYQHKNYFSAIGLIDIDDYDLFLKIDDDDFYRSYYVEDVVTDYRMNNWDMSGSHCYGTVNGRRWQPEVVLRNMGCKEGERCLGVSATWAFSRQAIKFLSSVDSETRDYEDNLWKTHLLESNGMKLYCRENPRHNYHQHVHGLNISTADWLLDN